MRFVQLLTLCDLTAPFSLNDLGCGYAALRRFIAEAHPSADVDYLGIDLSAAMVTLAEAELARYPGAAVVRGDRCPREADYSVASGIFNVCLDCGPDDWVGAVETTLRHMTASSRIGVAVNFLAPSSGPATAGLYRTPPARWVDFCQRELGAAVSLVAGYGMTEFTLLLR